MPHYNFLSAKIQHVWEALGRTGDQYVLIGGTALAYRLGHRISRDIDLCTSRPAEHPNVLKRKWNSTAIGKHKWLRRRPDHYIKFFETEKAPKINVHGRVPGGCLELPRVAPNGLRVASITDILKQKLVAMCDREQPRDGEDVAAILASGLASIENAVAALRDQTGMLGVGDAEVETLAQRLADLRHSPWRAFPCLEALAPALLSESCAAPSVACGRIEGPADVPAMGQGTRNGKN